MIIGYDILLAVLNVSGSSQFVSWLIVLTSWAKLFTGQSLILKFFSFTWWEGRGKAYFL